MYALQLDLKTKSFSRIKTEPFPSTIAAKNGPRPAKPIEEPHRSTFG
jgi:hypothetical protein